MKVLLTARGFELTDNVRDYVERRLNRLQRYHTRLSRVEIALTEEKLDKRVEARASIDGDIDLHAAATGEDFRSAVNRVARKLARQLKRRHDRHREHQAPRLGRDIPADGVG